MRVVTLRRKALLAIAAALLVTTACDNDGSQPAPRSEASPTGAPTSNGSTYAPDIDPADFVAVIDNPFFPLRPGTVFRLRGETEDGVEQGTITVTSRTKEVMGVTTTVVKDVVRVNGEIVESTFDWYAQDVDGNVWYFGEDTAEYEDGKVVSRSGSWEAGVDGAQPGIVMRADLQVTDSFRQEYYKGEAEDMFWVVETGVSKSVPFGSFDDVVRILEWSPLEPKVVGQKFYAPGVGLLAEKALSGGKEIVELIEIIQP